MMYILQKAELPLIKICPEERCLFTDLDLLIFEKWNEKISKIQKNSGDSKEIKKAGDIKVGTGSFTKV